MNIITGINSIGLVLMLIRSFKFLFRYFPYVIVDESFNL